MAAGYERHDRLACKALQLNRSQTSEPLDIRVGEFTVVHMHGSKLGTPMQRRDILARVEQAVRIEGVFDGMKLGQFCRIKLYTHLAYFFHANAVFTGDRAADFDADFQYLPTQFFGALQLTFNIGIVKYERVQIAVTSMENINDAKLVLLREFTDPGQYVGNLITGDGAVHAIVVR